MTISEVIKGLQEIQSKHGDLPVLGSADEEQNTIGDIFQIQVGEFTKFDFCPSNNYKEGDQIVVIVPAI